MTRLTATLLTSIITISTTVEKPHQPVPERGSGRRDMSAVLTITRKECKEYKGKIMGKDDGKSEYVRCKL